MSEQDIVISHDPTEPPAPLPPVPNTVFRGPNGIRAGWRVLIFFALMAACGGVLFVVVGALRMVLGGRVQFNASQLTPSGTLLTEGLIFVLTALPALIMAKIERRKFGEYGLSLRFAFGKNFWIGGI